MKAGKLYAVGIGPGDPELMTIKAARILNAAKHICVPRGSESGASVALGIIEQAIDLAGKHIIDAHFPMRKGTQRDSILPVAQEIAGIMAGGEDVIFVTLGDPVLFSTFFHLLDAIKSTGAKPGVEIVPGVTSITASGARAGINLALAMDKVAVIPASYMDKFSDILERFDTVVLMKVHSVFEDICKQLRQHGLFEKAVFVSRVGFQDEAVLRLDEVRDEHLSYFSTIIVRKKDG